MSIISLDIGDKNIGIAISDPLKIFAYGIATIKKENTILILEKLLEEYECERIIVGLPKTLKDKESLQTKKVQEFIDKLSSHFKIPIISWDERLSTKASERVFREIKVNRKKKKNCLHQLSAIFILQSYLDYIRKSNE